MNGTFLADGTASDTRLRRIAGWIAVVATPIAVALLVAFSVFSGVISRFGHYWLLIDTESIYLVDRSWAVLLRIWVGWAYILWIPLLLWFYGIIRMQRGINWARFQLSRRGICWRCGYDLRGTREHRCSECGAINGRGDLIRSDADVETNDPKN